MRLLYFAWVREGVGIGEEVRDPPAGVANVTDLLDWLAGEGEGYRAAFADRSRLRVAIDQEMASLDAVIAGAREIAIFPPVTGG